MLFFITDKRLLKSSAKSTEKNNLQRGKQTARKFREEKLKNETNSLDHKTKCEAYLDSKIKEKHSLVTKALLEIKGIDEEEAALPSNLCEGRSETSVEVKLSSELTDEEKYTEQMFNKYITPERRESILFAVNNPDEEKDKTRKSKEQKHERKEKIKYKREKKIEIKKKQKRRDKSKPDTKKDQKEQSAKKKKDETKGEETEKKCIVKTDSNANFTSDIPKKDSTKAVEYISTSKTKNINSADPIRTGVDVDNGTSRMEMKNCTGSSVLKHSTKQEKKGKKNTKLPKLVKPVLPSISVEQVLNEKKENQSPLPELKKPVFKVPKKKSSFNAPTKGKTVGGKRPFNSTLEELQICIEEPQQKIPKGCVGKGINSVIMN